MFKKSGEKEPITFTSENLAVPEVHVGHVDKQKDDPAPAGGVLYDTVAVPEFRPSQEQPEKKK